MLQTKDATEPAGRVDARDEPAGPAPLLSTWPGRLTLAYRAGLAAIVTVGVVAAFRVWWVGRALWNDETAIALNLRHLGYRGLTGGLEFQQVAPVGWLWMEKSLLLTLGEGERLLRLPSLVGVLGVLLLAPLAARLAAGRLAGLLTAAMVTVSPMILIYAGELKQYAFEAAIALALLLLGSEVARHDWTAARGRRWAIAGWVAATTLSTFLSLSALIVLAGVVAGLLLVLARARRWHELATMLLASVPAVALSGLLIWRRLSFELMAGQRSYFPNGTPPEGAGVGDILAWLPKMWDSFADVTLHWQAAALTLVLAVAGLVALSWRGRSAWAAMLCGVFVVAVAAAAVRGLPLADRVALYLVAPTMILVAAGIDGLARAAVALARPAGSSAPGRLSGPPRVAAAGLAALVLVAVAAGLVVQLPLRGAYDQTVNPLYKDPGPVAMAEVRQRRQPGDVVLAYWFSYRMTEWYAPQYHLSTARVRLYPDGCDQGRLPTLFAGARRVWYIQGRTYSGDPEDYLQLVSATLARSGRVMEIHHTTVGPSTYPTGWVLVDLTAGKDPAPPRPARPNASLVCLGPG